MSINQNCVAMLALQHPSPACSSIVLRLRLPQFVKLDSDYYCATHEACIQVKSFLYGTK